MNRLFSILFALVLIFTSSAPVSAQAPVDVQIKPQTTAEQLKVFLESLPQDYYDANLEFAATVQEMYHLMETESDMTVLEQEIKKTKAFKDLEKVQKKASLNHQEYTAEELAELAQIDALAQEYYDYYQIHGVYPNEAQDNAEGSEETLPPLNDAVIQGATAVTTAEGVTILEQIGIRYTQSQLAARLATLGTIAMLDGPLPVGDFIALVTGVCIFGYMVATLEWKGDAIAANIGTYEGLSYQEKALYSKSTSVTVRNNIRNGYKHFTAVLYNGPGGGIMVGPYISLQTAITRLDSNLNTFSATKSDAFQAALGASAVSGPAEHTPHNVSQQPNNLPHYHPTYLYVKRDGHAFFL